MSLSDQLFVSIKAQVINDQEYFNTTLGGISKFLQSNPRDILIIHGIGLYTYDILGIIYLLPQHIKEAVVVLIDFHSSFFALGKSYILSHLFLI